MFLRRKATAPLPDEDLLLRIRGGDRSSLGVLWDRYAHLLYGVGMKYLKDPERSKDTVLDVFEALPALLAKHEVRVFRPWVHAVMRNRCLLVLRGATRATPFDEAAAAGMVEDDADDRLMHEVTLQRLEAAIDALKEGQRECIRLFYLEHLSYQQVSERTGHDLEQVRSHLQNGRRNLRLQLERHGH
ncbi:MAG: sigma-70 family RNA polymerase sigma factor [Flavobacteriales bacterium]|nr:sigma-70 family RNA polymerase sigma factor [Flavobacteriales bacterium]